MPGIGQPPDPPTTGIGAPLFKPPGSSNISLPTDPRFVYSSVGGYVRRTTSGPSPRPLTLGEAIQEQQRENAARAWAAEEERKRSREKKYAPSPSSIASHQSSHYQTQRHAEVLELYNSIMYGDSKTLRRIPLELARAHGLFATEIAAIEEQAEDNKRREQEEFLKKARESFHSQCRKSEAIRQKDRQERQEGALKEISASKLDFRDLAEQRTPYFVKDYHLPGEKFVDKYMLLHQYPSVAKIFESYYTARFAPPWKDVFSDCPQIISKMLDWVRLDRENSVRGLKYFKYFNPPAWSWGALHNGIGKGIYRILDPEPDTMGWLLLDLLDISAPPLDSGPGAHLEFDFLDGFENFVKQYGEGAIVVFVLLMTLQDPKKWRKDFWQTDRSHNYMYKEPYNMLYMPALMNKDPLEIFMLFSRLADILPRLNISDDCRKYAWSCPHISDLNRYDWMKGAPRERFRVCLIQGGSDQVRSWNWEIKRLEESNDVQLLSKSLAQSCSHMVQSHWWTNSERLVRTYLMARACHIAKYGEKVANLTYPQPTIQGILPVQVADMVAFMVQLLQEEESRKVKQREQLWLTEHETRVQKEFDQKFRNKALPLPEYFSPRVLSDNEIEALKVACLKELC